MNELSKFIDSSKYLFYPLLQEEICYAVESINTHYFVDLGGVFYYDINFVGRQGFPLKIAATKGR